MNKKGKKRTKKVTQENLDQQIAELDINRLKTLREIKNLAKGPEGMEKMKEEKYVDILILNKIRLEFQYSIQ